MPARPQLTAREIVLGLLAGAAAAGGLALVLDDDDARPASVVATADKVTYRVAAFEEISTVGPQDVIVTIGDTPSVRAEGSPDALAQLEAVVEDGRLAIKPKDGFNFNWGRLASAEFHVTMPRLTGVTVAGSGDVRVDRVEGDEFEGSIAGPGSLAIADLRVDEADFSIGGSGRVISAGTVREARVSIGGSGAVEAGGLRASTATVSIGGSGDVALTVDSDAEISIAGSGDVDISGPARCSVSRMGSGNVTCNGEPQ